MYGIQRQWNVKKKCFDYCNIWFDGCNDYVCDMDNNIIGQTDKTCEFYKEAYCIKCESNLEWNDCGSSCTPTCINSTPVCSMICVARCECRGYKPILHDNHCIKKEDCFTDLLDD